MSTISPQAVEWLMTDTSPAKITAFNEKFGEGAAKQAIAEMNTPETPVEIQPVETQSWTDTAGDVALDIGEGVIKSPVSVATGLIEGGIANPLNYITETITGDITYGDDGFNYRSPSELKEMKKQGTYASYLDQDLDAVREWADDDSFTGNIITEASKFAGASIGVNKVFQGASKVEMVGKAALATFGAYEGDEGRITDMLLEMGVPDEMLPDFLETDPNDSETMGRLKNVIEEGPLGLVGLLALKAVSAVRRGDKAGLEAVVAEAEDIKADVEAPAPPSGDLEVANPSTSPFPEATPGFTMTPGEHRRISGLASKLSANPDADIKGSMGWRNFDSINTSEAASAEIAATAKVLAKKFEKTKGKPQSENLWKMQAGKKAKKLAEMTQTDEDKVLESISSGFENPRSMAAELIARENYALALQEDIVRIAKEIRASKEGGQNLVSYTSLPEAEMALLKRRNLAANVIAEVQGQRTNIGRAMRAMQLERKGDDKLKEILSSDKVAKAEQAKTVDEIISAALDDPKPNLSRMSNYVGKATDAVQFYRINAMLSGVSTQVVNTVSSGINMALQPISQMVGGAVTANPEQFFHATRQIRGTVGSMKETVRESLKVLYNNEAILDPYNARLDTMDPSKTKIGKIVGMPLRTLMTMDEFFKQSSYRGRIYADALGEAELLGHKGADVDKFVKDYTAKSFDEDGAALRGEALLQAQRSTFTENLGESSSKAQALIAGNRFAKFIVPFVKTPLNVVSQGIQLTPGLGVISGRWRADMAAGGQRRAQAIGKQTIGTALFGSAFLAANAGMMTGSGPRDPRVRKEWLKTNKPYSFVITSKDGSKRFISYQRLEPLSFPLSFAADFVEISQDETFKDGDLMGYAVAGITVFAENTVNKTFTQGIADVMEIMTGAEEWKVENWLEKNAGSFVPNLITQALSDDEMKEIRGVQESIMSRLGMDNSLNAKRNALGEPMYRPGHRMDPVGLVGADIRQHDPVQEEITRLAKAHQSGFGLPRSSMGDIDLKDIELNKGQSVYDAWIERSSTIEVGGKTLRQSLGKIINSRSYNRLQDGDVDFTGENEKTLKKIISKYREAAKVDLMRNHSKVKDLFTEMQQRKLDIKKPKRNYRRPIKELLQ